MKKFVKKNKWQLRREIKDLEYQLNYFKSLLCKVHNFSNENLYVFYENNMENDEIDFKILMNDILEKIIEIIVDQNNFDDYDEKYGNYDDEFDV